MTIRFLALLTCSMPFLLSCNSDHLVRDLSRLDEINRKYNERKDMYPGRYDELFSLAEKNKDSRETEALRFLFAFMPLSDIADYDGFFFLDNIRLSLKGREETKWGHGIPDDIFLHYVLPPRVNNENLDSFRIKYYDEIFHRIGSYDDLEQAALEINHWCHEKVSYQPADIRTSAPMATVLSARGRCGEESTFTVAALRTACIPARQIYTPRWAHTDDNHAWVEVWVNGEWKYLGACEPEPVLDRGWFTEPARRAMLTHTKAFGHYRGEESVVKKCDYYAEINTLSKYARTKLIHIRVVDNDNKAAENAIVEPRLYNYAEFYPLTEIPTDEKGLCSFETGLGDLLVWARKGESFGFEKVSVAGTDTVVIKLGDRSDMNDHYEFDLRAPMERIPFPDTLAKELKAQNTERLRKEDSIRQAYINSWMNDEQAEYLADSLDMDCEIVKDLIGRSMGNYIEIADFLRSAKAEHRDLLIKLLEVISDKDLRDTRASVLEDHLVNTIEYLSPGDYPEDIFTDYILNPRISHEIIKPWRSYIREYFEEADAENFVKDPYELVAWINENITLTCGENYYGVPVSPTGVLKTGSADELSRKILFTAICRTYGIPAGLEKGTNIPVFYSDASWKDIYFDDEEKNETEDAYLAFTYNGAIPVPEYFIHFTLARFKDGRYVTLDYDYNRKVTSFDDYLSLPAGEYMLVTGKRSGKSTVTATLEFFRIEPGEKKTLEIKLKKQAQAARVLATLDLDQVFRHDKGLKPLSSYSEEGLVLIWIDYDKEPGKHVLNNIPLVKDELDELGCQIIFLSDTAEENRSHDPEMLKGLPEKTLFGFDEDMSVLKSVAGKSPDEIRLPYVIYADAAGKIYYLSEGYNIGTGEQILKSILNR